ncbi:MAG TPA: hypothetical protein PLB18_20140, partial [Acidobacteriota bacterium]|nr:hypothetical protein [Acidobacteriota bacterium]
MFQRLRATLVVGLSSVMFLHGYTENPQANTQINNFIQEVKQPQNSEPGIQDPILKNLNPGEKHT